MPITRTTMIDDDGSGTTGTILNNAWLQTIYDQIDAFVGPWVEMPFAAANFTGTGSMVWTVASGDQVAYAYQVIGRTVFVQLTLVTTSVTGAVGTPFNVLLPAGLVPVKASDTVCYAQDNGVPIVGRGRLVAGDGTLRLYRADGTNWALSPDNTSLSTQFFYQV